MAKPTQETAPRGLTAGTVIDGRYRVLRYIGEGGAGLVHEVEHVLTGRRLAMKTLLEEAGYARLEQEAKATSVMKNPHAVKITDMGTGKGGAGAYLIMELLEGQNLRELLDQTRTLPVDVTVNLALQVCECLSEAHKLGIIHRDLKPDNLFLTASPWPGQHDVKVLDFGVVKISGEGPIPYTSLTRTGSTVGTPYYMSLEQLRNSSAVDARADIYSLGVVLYECLTGRTPFEEAETFGDLIYALCSGPPKHVALLRPDAPKELCDVVMRALSVQREDRQSSAEEVASALLPLGDPAFGLWLGAARGGAASAGREAPARGRHMTRPLPAAGVPARALALPAPDAADDGEWDTTTTNLIQTDGPSRPAHQVSAELAADAGAPESSGDRDTPTRALPQPRPLGDSPSGAYPNLASAPTVPAPERHSGAGMGPIHATVRLPVPEVGTPYPPPPAQPPLPAGWAAQRPSAEATELSFKPPWQRSLDGVLSRVGAALERASTGALTRFREATPNEQLALAVGGASLLAAVLVLLLYLAFS